MLKLKHPYISVTDADGRSYGGNQMRAEKSAIIKCGCGPVAALDMLLYLNAFHDITIPFFKGLDASAEISNEDYQRLLRRFIKTCLPIIPPIGMNGISLMNGVNLFFLKNKMPYSARWGVAGKSTISVIEAMLNDDIPVIMAIGPNFPKLWGDYKLSMYAGQQGEALYRAAETNAHFVTVTGIDDELMQVSSWGKKYYIYLNEFKSYVKRHSLSFFSSILYVREKHASKRS